MIKTDGRTLLLAVTFGVLLLSSLGASAQDVAASAPNLSASAAQLAAPTTLLSPPNWAALTPAQKMALAPLEHEWDGLDDPRKSIWLEMAPQFSALPAVEQLRLHERMRAWVSLSPAERQRARINYQVAKQKLRAGEREAKWEAYQALPPEKRKELAEKAAARRLAARQPCVLGHNCAAANLKASPKSNRVPDAKPLQIKAVAPSLVQAKPGATTVLITQARAPVVHPTPGLTKIVADPALVDPKTLLPRRRPAASPQ